MRRNLGLCQIVHLRCTAANSSPKLGEVARSDGGVCHSCTVASSPRARRRRGGKHKTDKGLFGLDKVDVLAN